VVEPFGISAFEVPHDSEGGCYGFNIYRKSESGEKKITISTDMGYPGGGLVNKFVNSDAIIIESNHDPEMLENSNRPWFLKKRITEIGHLSNEQCAGFLVEIMKGSDFLPGSVLLYHISQQCNTNKLAEECTRRALDNNNFKTVKIVQTFKDSPSNVIKIY
jgi:phosphoribosyl 1,2-cyclic phosphodiesterase